MNGRRKLDPFVLRGTLSGESVGADLLELLPEILNRPPGRIEIETERIVDDRTGEPLLLVEIRTSATRLVAYQYPRHNGGWILGGAYESLRTAIQLLRRAAGGRGSRDMRIEDSVADSNDEVPR